MPVRRTRRLRLEPVGPEHAGDLWRLHQDEAVAAWHGGRWTAEDARRYAVAMAAQWAADGVGKWIAYRLGSGELVGRGGLAFAAEDLGAGEVVAFTDG
jgi:[ribosomal protein S5]-alanine N-acetyltransferase